MLYLETKGTSLLQRSWWEEEGFWESFLGPLVFCGLFFCYFGETPESFPPLLPVTPALCSRVTLSRKTAVHVDWG